MFPTKLLVPAMLAASSLMMAFAWIGHLRYARTWSFWQALAVSWFIVLPEYLLNVSATRWGRGTFTGAQMATFHMCAGIVCVALISRFFLGEPMSLRQLAGFGLMIVSVVLINSPSGGSS